MFASEWVLGINDAQDALFVRRAVFEEELGQPADIVFDASDAIAAHLVIRLDGVPVASARLCPDEQGARLAFVGVLKEYRKQGFGDLCARILLDKAQRMGFLLLVADVPSKYVPYYESFGFSAQGDAVVSGILPMAVKPEAILWHSPCKDAQ